MLNLNSISCYKGIILFHCLLQIEYLPRIYIHYRLIWNLLKTCFKSRLSSSWAVVRYYSETADFQHSRWPLPTVLRKQKIFILQRNFYSFTPFENNHQLQPSLIKLQINTSIMSSITLAILEAWRSYSTLLDTNQKRAFPVFWKRNPKFLIFI